MNMPLPIPMYLAVETPSLSNMREHWSRRKKRASLHRMIVHAAWVQLGRPSFEFPVEVILTRVSPRPLDDDNLRGALKSCRDGIAAALGVDDNDPRVTWRYDQARGEPKQHGVRVLIGEVSTLCPTCGQKRSAV